MSQSNDAEESTAGLFFTKDGRMTTTLFLLLLSLALYLIMMRCSWWYGALLALVSVLCRAAQNIRQEDKQEIRYNILDPEEILGEMIAWEESLASQQQQQQVDDDEHDSTHQHNRLKQAKLIFNTGLAALAKKYDKMTSTTKEKDDLALLCQQAAYIGFRCFPDDNDEVVAASLSLLALVAKNEQIRERHMHEADVYGLDQPIGCMRRALLRAKGEDNPKREQLAAELQRKGCLMLGALSDGDAAVATQVVQEGGLDAILDAVSWYRFHANVANWALWAVFILCYENSVNKVAVVQADGIPIIIQTMRNCPKSVDVARHGIALLFDLMRQSDESESVWKIRTIALESGLHQVVVHAMESFSSAMDIMMMGQEILVGTSYQGDIPEFQPS